MTWKVMAHRSGFSRFGACSAPLKANGKVLTFETREEAEAKVAETLAGIKSLTALAVLSYTVEKA